MPFSSTHIPRAAGLPYIDLTRAPYNVVADDDDPAVALANAVAINAAIVAGSALGGVCLNAPDGVIYLDKTGTNWSIRFANTISWIHLRGQGMGATSFAQKGVGTGNDWHLFDIDGATNVTISDAALYADEILCSSDGQHDHLIQVANGGATIEHMGINLYNLHFGKTTSDAIFVLGDTNPVCGVRIHNITMELQGIVIPDWQAGFDYPVNAYVHTFGTEDAFRCTDAGVSAGTAPVNTLVFADMAITTVTNGSDTMTKVGHGLITGDGPLRLTTSGGLPAGLLVATDYWMIRITDDTFKIAASLALALAGTPIDITTDGTGVQTVVDTASTERVAGIIDGGAVWTSTGATYRQGARTGITLQRGYNGVSVTEVSIRGAQNSLIDQEATSTGVMRGSFFSNIHLDNSQGRTSTAWSWSGSNSGSDPMDFCGIDGAYIYGGRFQIVATENSYINNVIVHTDEATVADSTLPLVEIRGINRGLKITNLNAYRMGTSGAGVVIDIEGETAGGDSVTFANCKVVQETDADPITSDSMSDLIMNGIEVQYSGAYHVDRIGIQINATIGNANRPQLSNIKVSSETVGAMPNAVAFGARQLAGTPFTAYSMTDISVIGLHCSGVLNAVQFSKDSACSYDNNPILIGVNPGAGTLYTTLDEAGGPTTDQIFPTVGGSKKGGAVLIGVIAPDGVVGGAIGTTYLDVGATPAVEYLKAEGINKFGWALKTAGTPSVTVLEMPSTSAEWTTFKAANNITALPTPTRAWDCQDGAGDLSPSIGSLDLIASGAVTYSEAVSGYSDVAVGIPMDGASTGFTTTDAALANPATTSYFALVIGRITGTPGGSRGLIHLGDQNQLRTNTTPALRVLIASTDSVVSGTLTTGVHCYFAGCNETLNTVIAGTEDAYLEPAYVTPSTATKRFGIGGFDASSQAFHAMRIYEYEGADADLMMIPANLALVLQAMNAGVVWA